MINGLKTLTGLRIYLEGGHVISVKSTPQIIAQVVNFPPGSPPRLFAGDCLSTGISWSCRSDKIVAAHSFDWEVAQAMLAAQQQALTQQQMAPLGSRGMSGPH